MPFDDQGRFSVSPGLVGKISGEIYTTAYIEGAETRGDYTTPDLPVGARADFDKLSQNGIKLEGDNVGKGCTTIEAAQNAFDVTFAEYCAGVDGGVRDKVLFWRSVPHPYHADGVGHFVFARLAVQTTGY